MSMPVIKLRQSAQFPANVYGDNGVNVSKANGNYTIALDYSDFATITTLPDGANSYILSYNTTTQSYVLVPSGEVTGLTDAPSNGLIYGRENANWVETATKISIDAADALKADKTYVDTQNATKVAKAGDTMTGPLSVSVASSALAGTTCSINFGYPGPNGMCFRPAADGSNTIIFRNAADGNSGIIFTTSTTTTYGTSSDGRLKENLQEFDAGRIVDDTEVYSFTWKSTGERSYGVIAQQANEIYPAAVIYWKQEDWWGIDYSKYTPVLLQELKALRARVAALEAKLDKYVSVIQ